MTSNLTEKYGANTDISNWNFREFHLALDRGGKNQGTFMTPEATLMAAGPPRLKDMDDPANVGGMKSLIAPIALTDNVAVNQNKMLQQIFEIGSRRSYFVSGHTTGTVAVSRPMFNGPSILRLLTSMTKDYGSKFNNSPAAGYSAVGGMQTGPVDETKADFYINLQAEIFDRPVGLLFYMIDQRNEPYGSMYVEDANIQAHAFNIAAQAMTVVENISMLFDMVRPVAVVAA